MYVYVYVYVCVCISVEYSLKECMLLKGRNFFLNTFAGLYPEPRKLPGS